jgi:hypothetical protein
VARRDLALKQGETVKKVIALLGLAASLFLGGCVPSGGK